MNFNDPFPAESTGPDDTSPDATRLDSFLRDRLGAYRPEPSAAVWRGIEARVGAGAVPAPRRRFGTPRTLLPAVFTGVLGVLIGWLLPHSMAPAVSVAAVADVAPVGPVVVPAAPASQPNPAAVTGRGAQPTSQYSSQYNSLVATTRVGGTRAYAASKGQAREGSTAGQAAAPVRLATVAVTSSVGNALPSSTGNTVVLGAGASAALPVVLLPLAVAENAVQNAGQTASAHPPRNAADSAPPATNATAGDTDATTARTRYTAALLAEKDALARLQRRADSLLHLLSLGAEATALAATSAVAATVADGANPVVIVRHAPALTHRWQVAAAAGPEHLAWTRTTSGGRLETGRTALSAALNAEYLLTEHLSLSAGVGYARLVTDVRTGTEAAARRAAYHFLTVPLLVRYRLTPVSRSTRCWADVAAGVQGQWFRRGTEGAAETTGTGPFGGPTVAILGGLGLNYAVAPRLTVRAAPTLRWQPRHLTSTGLVVGVGLTL